MYCQFEISSYKVHIKKRSLNRIFVSFLKSNKRSNYRWSSDSIISGAIFWSLLIFFITKVLSAIVFVNSPPLANDCRITREGMFTCVPFCQFVFTQPPAADQFLRDILTAGTCLSHMHRLISTPQRGFKKGTHRSYWTMLF